MARRTREVTIQPNTDGSENRDAGKKFLLTEVDAITAEEWGLRALMALGTSGIVVPQELANLGLIGAVIVGYQAFMGAKQEDILPLWREMLPKTVQYTPSPGVVMPYNPILFEEASTLLHLRQQVMELHTGFTFAELARRFQTLGSAINTANSQTTQTSPNSSER